MTRPNENNEAGRPSGAAPGSTNATDRAFNEGRFALRKRCRELESSLDAALRSLGKNGNEITDSDRLNWLIQMSGLDPSDCDGQEIYLIVSSRAVAKCHGTHLSEYRRDVRAAIDAALRSNTKLTDRVTKTSTGEGL